MSLDLHLLPLHSLFWSKCSSYLLPRFSATLALHSSLLTTPTPQSYPVFSPSSFLSLISPLPHLAFPLFPTQITAFSILAGLTLFSFPWPPLILVPFHSLLLPFSTHHPSASNMNVGLRTQSLVHWAPYLLQESVGSRLPPGWGPQHCSLEGVSSDSHLLPAPLSPGTLGNSVSFLYQNTFGRLPILPLLPPLGSWQFICTSRITLDPSVPSFPPWGPGRWPPFSHHKSQIVCHPVIWRGWVTASEGRDD